MSILGARRVKSCRVYISSVENKSTSFGDTQKKNMIIYGQNHGQDDEKGTFERDLMFFSKCQQFCAAWVIL